jgi:hypothetical protein
MANNAGVNKSQVIRDAVAAHPEKSNKELSEFLKTQGMKIKPTYIATIKGNMKRKKKKGRRAKLKGVKRHVRGADHGNGYAGVGPALEFIKAAGGLGQAKAALETIEEIGKVVG